MQRSWVRMPLGAWMFVCCEYCVLSGRGLCDELITRPEETHRLWCVIVCDLVTSRMRRPWPTLVCSTTGGGGVGTLQGSKCPSFLDLRTLGDKVTVLSQNVRIWHSIKSQMNGILSYSAADPQNSHALVMWFLLTILKSHSGCVWAHTCIAI